MNAFKSGQLAYEGDKNISDNPYNVHSLLYHQWESGWYDAEQFYCNHDDEVLACDLQDVERYDYSMFMSDIGG